MSHCGTCTACCRVFDVAEVNSRAGEWCSHCDIGKGCKIYAERPKPCVQFECFWLMSQKRKDPLQHLPASLRPDRSKVVFAPTTNDKVMAAITMPGAPLAWQRKDVRALIEVLVEKASLSVVVGPPGATQRKLISRDGERDVTMSEPDEDGMQYNLD